MGGKKKELSCSFFSVFFFLSSSQTGDSMRQKTIWNFSKKKIVPKTESTTTQTHSQGAHETVEKIERNRFLVGSKSKSRPPNAMTITESNRDDRKNRPFENVAYQLIY